MSSTFGHVAVSTAEITILYNMQICKSILSPTLVSFVHL